MTHRPSHHKEIAAILVVPSERAPVALPTVSRLLTECGFQPMYADMGVCGALGDLDHPVYASTLLDWLRGIHCTHIVFASTQDPAGALAQHTRLVRFLERHQLSHCPFAQIRRLTFVGSAAACARISSLGCSLTACVSGEDSQLEVLAQLGLQISDLPVALRPLVAYDEQRSRFGREVVLEQAYLHEDLCFVHGGRVLRNGRAIALCRGDTPAPPYWLDAPGSDADPSARSGVVRHVLPVRGDLLTLLAEAVASSRMAFERGAHTFILETEINPPGRTWGVVELARLRAAYLLLRGDGAMGGTVRFHLRIGVSHRFSELWKNEISLAASAALMGDVEAANPEFPSIIEVFHQSLGSSCAHPNKIEDSARLVLHAFRKHARLRARGDLPDMSLDMQVLSRTHEIVARVTELLSGIGRHVSGE